MVKKPTVKKKYTLPKHGRDLVDGCIELIEIGIKDFSLPREETLCLAAERFVSRIKRSIKEKKPL